VTSKPSPKITSAACASRRASIARPVTWEILDDAAASSAAAIARRREVSLEDRALSRSRRRGDAGEPEVFALTDGDGRCAEPLLRLLHEIADAAHFGRLRAQAWRSLGLNSATRKSTAMLIRMKITANTSTSRTHGLAIARLL
jgi:hypothetical protein